MLLKSKSLIDFIRHWFCRAKIGSSLQLACFFSDAGVVRERAEGSDDAGGATEARDGTLVSGRVPARQNFLKKKPAHPFRMQPAALTK